MTRQTVDMPIFENVFCSHLASLGWHLELSLTYIHEKHSSYDDEYHCAYSHSTPELYSKHGYAVFNSKT